jgi:uncharacterized protein (TIGR02147 family)
MLIERMKRTLEERCKNHPAYSLRAFARSLDMDSSTLSALLRRKRPITLKTARKLVEGLKITDAVEAQALIVDTFKTKATELEANYTELSLEKAEALASWEHFALLALLELKNIKTTERILAAKLGLPISQVWEALHRLERLELIHKKGQQWELTGNNMATPSDVPSKSLREGHKQNILKSIESIDRDAIELRDISGISIAISRKRLKGAKKMIQEFRHRLAKYLEDGDKDAVYRLNIQLFPLTKELQK